LPVISGRAVRWFAAGGILAAFTVVFIQTAWVSDDAMITFRSVEQFHAGNGPRWNPHERVQAFTHPLWFALLALARLLTRDLILAVTALSFAAAAAAIAVAGRCAPHLLSWVLGFAAFVASRALLDYSSSGLETALVYLLLAVLFRLGPRPDRLRLWLVLSALLLCRLDLAPLLAPLAAMATARGTGRPWRIALGLLPLAAWTAFSVVYYGVPLPNTAYAKLLTGIPTAELVVQGLRYLAHSARWDPFTLLLIAGGSLARTPFGFALPLGVGLQVGYTVWVGGDFMAGRFLAPIAWLGLLALVGLTPRLRAPSAAAVAVTIAVFTLIPNRWATWDHREQRGIADERRYYTQSFGLRAYLANGRRVLRADGGGGPGASKVAIRYTIGWAGWSAPLDRILVDPLGLADPLLARLPCRPLWRVGHYLRDIPDGYLESLGSGENRIVDPALRAEYADLVLVTRGDLWAAERWAAIRRLNLAPRASIGGG
jgi:arabinofuranosyltransferase